MPAGRPKYWIKSRAIALGEEILKWMDDNPEEKVPAAFFNLPETRQRGLYHDLPAQLASEYPEFQRLWGNVLSIAETRIVQGALALDGNVNAKFASFYLERRAKGFAPPRQDMHHEGVVTQKHEGSLTINFVERQPNESRLPQGRPGVSGKDSTGEAGSK